MTANKRVIGIALLTALAILGDMLLTIVLPIRWKEFGLTALWQIGVIFSVNRIVRLPLNPLIGLFYKKFQLRTGLTIAIILAFITTFSYGILHDFWLLVVMRAIWGIAWGFLRLGGFLTVMEVSTKDNRGKLIGMYNGLWGLGGLVGMLGAGILVDQTTVFFVATLFACCALFSFPMIYWFVPKKQKEEETKEVVESSKGFHFSRYIWMVLITGATMGFIVFGSFTTTLSPLIERVFSDKVTLLGITIGAASIAGIIQALRWGWDPFLAQYIGRKLDASKNQINFLYLALITGGVLNILLGFAHSIILLIFLLLIFQFISTLFVTTTDTLATNAASQSKQSINIITAHTVVVDIGASLGPLFAFMLVEFYSITAVYIMASFVMLALACSWFVFQKKNISGS
jgi:MFS family permease